MALVKRMTERRVLGLLATDLLQRGQHTVVLDNFYSRPDSEADLFALGRDGLCDEFEVKLSLEDFNRDKNKTVFLQVLNQKVTKWAAISQGRMPCNRFWFVLGPKVRLEIPSFAGVIHLGNLGTIQYLRPAPLLHELLVPPESLTRKLNSRYWDLKTEHSR